MAAASSTSSQCQHYPNENRRYGEIFRLKNEKYKDEIEEEIHHLDSTMEAIGGDKAARESAFKKWCVEHARKWEDIGKVAHAVPPYYITKYGAGLLPLIDSDLRGEEAQRRVANAFRLLNNKFQENGLPTMFIIIGCWYEHVLYWLRGRKYAGKFPKKRHQQVERHEADILALHPEKGAVFVQVKSVGAEHCDPAEKAVKMDKGIKQLTDDETVYTDFMGHHARVANSTTLVLALPNMKKKDGDGIKKRCKAVIPTNLLFLYEEDLPIVKMDIAESETDLRVFSDWWEKLPNRAIPLDQISDAAARYVGVFSTPSDYTEKTERNHVRDVGDSIRITGRLVKRLVLTREQSAILSKQKKGNKEREKRVHVYGAPGTGKTLLLIKRGQQFAENKDHVVFVLNMYRGAQGRPVGQQIYDAVCNGEPGIEERIHHLRVDVGTIKDTQTFKQKVEDELKKSKQKAQGDKILFLIDEPPPAEHWQNIMQSLLLDFKSSFIWYASDLKEPFDETFKRVTLTVVYRIPPSVQHVLYNVDTERAERERYMADSNRHAEVADNGPTPVCIRHAPKHTNVELVMDCQQCAKELVQLLKDTFKVTSSGSDVSATSKGAAAISSQSKPILPCTVAILFNLPPPREGAQTRSMRFSAYRDKVEGSKLVKELKTVAPVYIVKDPGDFQFNADTHFLVSWSDIVQGLEWDIVAFVPSGKAESRPKHTEAQTEETKLPTRSAEAKTKPSPKEDPIASTSSGGAKPKIKKDVEQKPSTSSGRGEQTAAGKSSPSSDKAGLKRPHQPSEYGLAHKYWRGNDLKRYSAWDKKGLVSAASTCTAQLVLMVPDA